MGNTANFEGAVLYASQSPLAISGGLKKQQDETLSANLKMRPVPVLIVKSAHVKRGTTVL